MKDFISVLKYKKVLDINHQLKACGLNVDSLV